MKLKRNNKILISTLFLFPMIAHSATCGIKENIDAVCFADEHPEAFERTRPVAKMFIDKGNGNSGSCTAWRVGAGDLMMTNYHCFEWDILSIDSPEQKAQKINAKMPNITLQFNYQNQTCGVMETKESLFSRVTSVGAKELVTFNDDLDFVLFKIKNPELVEEFGHFGLDISPITERKQIFIPQHSNGDPKLLGLQSDHPSDDGFCHMYINEQDATKVNYYCDTQGMGSGSPVLNYANKKVTALHFWGSDDPNCETDTNSAHQMSSIWPLISSHFNNEVPQGDLVYDPGNGGTTPPDNGSGNTISFGENNTVSGLASSLQLFSLDAQNGLDTITVNTSGGTGDADLYIKFGSEASSSNYDCKSSTSTNNETCSLPAQVGNYSIAIKGYSDFSNVNLIATSTTSTTEPVQGELNNGAIVNAINLAKDETKQFYIDVPADQNLVVSSSGGLGDTDLYISFENIPTTSSFDCRSWNSGNNESCEVTNSSSGRYYILLSGYKASEGISLKTQY